MQVYSAQARERIGRVVRDYEANSADGTTQQPKHFGGQLWSWWVLTEPLDADTHEAKAHPLEWYVKGNSGDGEYEQDISFYMVRDTLENSGATAGSIVLCRPIGSENGTVLEIVVGPKLIPIMLKTSLTPGGTADAYPTEPDGTIIDEELYWEVSDLSGDLRAPGKDDVDSGDGDGAKGLVEMVGDGTLAIVRIQQQAKRCKCSIDDAGGIEDTDSSINVDNVKPTDGGLSPLDDPDDTAEDMTVYIQLNPSSSGGFTGADNTVCYIEWHEDDDKYYIYEMPCSA